MRVTVKITGILLYLLLFSRAVTYAQLPQLTVQTGHTDDVVNLQFSDDGKYLASAGKDNIIIIWDYNLGKQIKRLIGHTGAVNCMKFFNAGTMLATCSDDGKLLIWDLLNETVIKSMPQVRSARIVSLDVSPDESNIIFCGNPYYVGKWDLKSNKVYEGISDFSNSPVNYKFKSDVSDYIKVGYSKDGKSLYVCKSGSVYFFNSSDPKSDRVYEENLASAKLIKAKLRKKGRSIQWMWSDDKFENIVFSDININLKKKKTTFLAYPEICKLDVPRTKKLFKRSSDFNKYKFTAGSVNADHSFIAAGNEDNKIYLWNFVTGKEFEGLEGASAVSAVAFHPQNKDILVSSDAGRDIYVWDISNRKMLRKFRSTTFPITAIAVNNAGDIIAIAGSDNSIKVLNISENIYLKSIEGNESNISGLGFTADEKGLISVGVDNRIKFWNLDADKLEASIKGNSNVSIFNAFLNLPLLSVYANTFTSYFFTKSLILNDLETLRAMAISPDNKYTAAGGTGFRSGYFYKFLSPRMLPVHIINNQSQKIDKKLLAHYISVDALAFNSNGNILASGGHDYKMTGKTLLESNTGKKGINMPSEFKRNYNEINSLKIWDIKNHQLFSAFETKSPVRSLAFDTNSDSLLFADEDKNIVLFDYHSNKAVKLEKGMGPLLFLPDEKSFLFQDKAYSIKQFDLHENKVIAEFKGHTDKITSAAFIQNGKRLITGGWDGTLKIWDVEKGKEIVTLYAINSTDFLIKTPENYYFATKNAVNEIGFTFGMKFYPFEQFDLKYNRPDLVLKHLGNASDELIAAYYRAYQKRIKKLGFTEDMLSDDFHVPEVAISNQAEIEPVTGKRNLVLNIQAKDSKYPLDRINIWINDVAILGTSGMNLRSEESQSVSKTVDIQLTSGENKIQISALNQKGAESLKEIVEVNFNAPAPKPDLYLISIGISKYIDSRFNLNYASKDAGDISRLFRGDTALFGHTYIKTLTDDQVKTSALEEIRDFVRKAGRDDVVMMFIAGHGLLDSKLDYYFGTYDMDFNNPSAKGIIYEDIESLFDGITALKKILFMDTCFSGEVDKDEMELAKASSSEFGNVTFRSAGAGVRMKEGFGAENTSEIMKELFTDIRKGTGSTVISSAGGAEVAMEGDLWKNGLFTFCVLNGLSKKAADENNDGAIMLSELQDYVRSNVSKLSGGRQSPTSRVQNVSLDFRIW